MRDNNNKLILKPLSFELVLYQAIDNWNRMRVKKVEKIKWEIYFVANQDKEKAESHISK